MHNSIQTLANTHYENFPVSRLFIGKKYRHHVSAIYAFARMADDIADEESGEDAKQRHVRLNTYAMAVQGDNYSASKEETFMLKAVQKTITQCQLPVQPFIHLISAFQQDLVKKTYLNHEERMAYCALSANPIGELLLRIFKQDTPKTIHYSNAICSALQIVNFLQDIHSDYTVRGRIYLPLADLQHLSIPSHDLFNPDYRNAIAQLMRLELQRCRHLLLQGQALLNCTHGRLKAQIAAILACAKHLIYKLERRAGGITKRPTLGAVDAPKLIYHWLTYNYQ